MSDSEAEFFARLRADGLLVRERFSRRDTGEVTGYAVALPGHVNREGRPVWFGGGRLAADFTLPKLRHRWTGTPATLRYGSTARDAAWSAAIDAAARATNLLRFYGAGSPAAADIAWATSDILRVTAWRLRGDPCGLLRRAADTYDRAARTPYGRLPISTAGSGLRAAARVLAETSADDDRMSQAVAALLGQLAQLADAVARLRTVERSMAQALAAGESAGLMRDASERSGARSVRPERGRNTPADPDRSVVALAARDFPNSPFGGDERPHQATPDPVSASHTATRRRSRR
jgi:hypothetical protein